MESIAVIGLRDTVDVSGGIEEHVAQITRHSKLKYTLYCRGKGVGENKVYIPTIKSKHLETPIYSFLATLHALTKGHKIFHYHALGPAINCVVPKLLGKKVVVTIHGLDWERKKWGTIAKFYLKLAEQVIKLFADEIIVVSKKLKKEFPKATYIGNGVEIKDGVVPNLILEYGLNKGNYILYLGRITPEKNIELMLEAKTEYKKVVAGDGDIKYLDKLKSYEAIFTGRVSGQLKDELLSNAAYFILPSDVEGQSISLLEAMSYGTKVIVSDIEENKEVVKKWGKVINDCDMLENALREDWSNIGQIEYIKENFNWDTKAKETEEIYGRL